MLKVKKIQTISLNPQMAPVHQNINKLTNHIYKKQLSDITMTILLMIICLADEIIFQSQSYFFVHHISQTWVYLLIITRGRLRHRTLPFPLVGVLNRVYGTPQHPNRVYRRIIIACGLYVCFFNIRFRSILGQDNN